jgi:hypothetical protein
MCSKGFTFRVRQAHPRIRTSSLSPLTSSQNVYSFAQILDSRAIVGLIYIYIHIYMCIYRYIYIYIYIYCFVSVPNFGVNGFQMEGRTDTPWDFEHMAGQNEAKTHCTNHSYLTT